MTSTNDSGTRSHPACTEGRACPRATRPNDPANWEFPPVADCSHPCAAPPTPAPTPAISNHPWFVLHPLSHHNILWHWERATRDEVERGTRWYRDAHQLAVAIADGKAHLGAGVLALYSPQQGWTVNVLTAARVLSEGRGLGGPGSGIFASTSQKNAATRLLNGEPHEEVLTGPKVRSFAHLIEFGGDHDPDQPHATIDRHALSVVHGDALDSVDYESAPLSGFRRRDGSISCQHYDSVVNLYRQAADLITHGVGTPVAAHQVQAVTWLVRQRLNQQAEQQRGLTRLDRGRQRARTNVEQAWTTFRAKHFPHLEAYPGTGYEPAA